MANDHRKIARLNSLAYYTPPETARLNSVAHYTREGPSLFVVGFMRLMVAGYRWSAADTPVGAKKTTRTIGQCRRQIAHQ